MACYSQNLSYEVQQANNSFYGAFHKFYEEQEAAKLWWPGCWRKPHDLR